MIWGLPLPLVNFIVCPTKNDKSLTSPSIILWNSVGLFFITSLLISDNDSSELSCFKPILSTSILTSLVNKLDSQSKVNSENIDKLLLNVNVNNKKIRVLEESSEEMNQAFNISDDDDDDDYNLIRKWITTY